MTMELFESETKIYILLLNRLNTVMCTVKYNTSNLSFFCINDGIGFTIGLIYNTER